MGILLFVIFLLGLPSQAPYSMDEDWNDDVNYNFSDEISIIQTNESWNGSLEIDIVNTASITQNWQLELAMVDGVVSSHWDLRLCSVIIKTQQRIWDVVMKFCQA